MRHLHSHTTHSRSGNDDSPMVLLGLAGLLVGGAYCLRNHTPQNGNNSGDELQHSDHNSSSNTGWLLGAAAAGVAGILLGGKKFSETSSRNTDIRLESAVTINRTPEDVYDFWKNLSNLPRVMSFLERIEPREGNVSHWVAKGPGGTTVQWDSEIVGDEPGRLLSWQSVDGSELLTWGTVHFRPRSDNRGTEVDVVFHFCPPGNATGTAARFLSGLENTVLEQNLRNLKAHLETGEVATSRRFSKGPNGGVS